MAKKKEDLKVGAEVIVPKVKTKKVDPKLREWFEIWYWDGDMWDFVDSVDTLKQAEVSVVEGEPGTEYRILHVVMG